MKKIFLFLLCLIPISVFADGVSLDIQSGKYQYIQTPNSTRCTSMGMCNVTSGQITKFGMFTDTGVFPENWNYFDTEMLNNNSTVTVQFPFGDSAYELSGIFKVNSSSSFYSPMVYSEFFRGLALVDLYGAPYTMSPNLQANQRSKYSLNSDNVLSYVNCLDDFCEFGIIFKPPKNVVFDAIDFWFVAPNEYNFTRSNISRAGFINVNINQVDSSNLSAYLEKYIATSDIDDLIDKLENGDISVDAVLDDSNLISAINNGNQDVIDSFTENINKVKDLIYVEKTSPQLVNFSNYIPLGVYDYDNKLLQFKTEDLVESDSNSGSYVRYYDPSNLFDLQSSFCGGHTSNGNTTTTGVSTCVKHVNSVDIVNTSQWRGIVTDFISVEPDSQYSISYEVNVDTSFSSVFACYDSNKNYIGRTTGSSYTTSSDCHFIRVAIQHNNIGTFTISNIMLNKGPLKSYIPYSLPGVAFDLDDPQTSRFYLLSSENNIEQRNIALVCMYMEQNYPHLVNNNLSQYDIEKSFCSDYMDFKYILEPAQFKRLFKYASVGYVSISMLSDIDFWFKNPMITNVIPNTFLEYEQSYYENNLDGGIYDSEGNLLSDGQFSIYQDAINTDFDFQVGNSLSVIYSMLDVIKFPLKILETMSDYENCTPLTFRVFNKDISIPCGTTLFWGRSDVQTFRYFWNILFGGFAIYNALAFFIRTCTNVIDPISDLGDLSNLVVDDDKKKGRRPGKEVKDL